MHISFVECENSWKTNIEEKICSNIILILCFFNTSKFIFENYYRCVSCFLFAIHHHHIKCRKIKTANSKLKYKYLYNLPYIQVHEIQRLRNKPNQIKLNQPSITFRDETDSENFRNTPQTHSHDKGETRGQGRVVVTRYIHTHTHTGCLQQGLGHFVATLSPLFVHYLRFISRAIANHDTLVRVARPPLVQHDLSTRNWHRNRFLFYF